MLIHVALRPAFRALVVATILGADLFAPPRASAEAQKVRIAHSYIAAIPAVLREKLGGHAVRFAHIDSHHARECLTNDLELIHAVLHPDGIICLDDMLHPGYPMLAAAAFDYLARHPEMRLLCIVDREDIVAAPKFLICREAMRGLYEHDLMEAFARFHFPLNADMESYFALVLTPWPRLAEVG